MNKIEVGEYVRTESGIIIKVDFLDYEKLTIAEKGIGFDFDDIEEMEEFIKNEIVKHSKNIIDLIEIKDIVRVHNLKGDIFDFTIEIFDDKTMIDLQLALDNNELKLLSILTHEQYNQNCYRLEE